MAQTQTPAEELKAFKKKYPGEHAVIMDYRAEMHIDFKGGKWVIYTDYYEEVFYLTKTASNYSREDIYYSHTYDKVDKLEAYTLVPDAKGYKKNVVKKFNYSDARSEGIFHDDFKNISFYFPNLEEGYKSVYKYRIYDLDPHLLGKFNLYRFWPAEKMSVKIFVSKNASINLKPYHMEGYKGSSVVNTVKGVTSYIYEANNLVKRDTEEDQPSTAHIFPHVIPVIAYGLKGKDTIPVLRNSDDLNTWLQSMAGKCDRSNDAELKEVVDSLTNGVTSELDKIKNIYYWVQDNIHYVAFEDGLWGYVPHSAYSVYSQRFGDCKDMSNIIYTMLNMAGVEAYLTTIGTRDIPYEVRDLHTPQLFNHMIVAVKYDGSFYFLDGTASYTPWDFVPEGIQDKECMVLLKNNEYKVLRTPTMDYKLNVLTDTIRISWTGKSTELAGTGIMISTGYYKHREQFVLNYLKNDRERLDEFVKDRYSRGNNKCIVDTAWFENQESRSEPLYSMYRFHLNDYAKALDNEIFVNPHLIKYYQDDEVKEDRKYPVEKYFHAGLNAVCIIDIPKGYTVDYLPPDVTYTSGRFEASITYKRVGDQIICEQKYIEKNLMIENALFEEWNKIIKSLNKSYNEVIVFKKLG